MQPYGYNLTQVAKAGKGVRIDWQISHGWMDCDNDLPTFGILVNDEGEQPMTTHPRQWPDIATYQEKTRREEGREKGIWEGVSSTAMSAVMCP